MPNISFRWRLAFLAVVLACASLASLYGVFPSVHAQGIAAPGTIADLTGTSAALAPGSVTPSSGGKRLLVTGRTQTHYPADPKEIETAATSVDSGFTITANLAGVINTSEALAMAYLVETAGGVAKNPTWTFPNTGAAGYAAVSVMGFKP